MLRQQRIYGNRHVQRLVQAKLNVSQPGDLMEREADEAAERIMGTSDGRGASVGEGVSSDISSEIMPHAESAVSTASSTAGQPLPGNLQRKFEGVLGADLSGVRIHTGSESARASQAISARAYTVNNHIHFSAGEYDPSTAEGQRLLAHEVAHTVQQGGRLGRKTATIYRDKAEDLNQMAEAGEAIAVADQQANVNQPPVGRVSNVRDVAAAQALIAQIEGWRANMQQGTTAGGAFTVSEGRVTPEKMAANETAIQYLDDYLVTAGEQGRTLGGFQEAVRKARVDFERLKAQVTHLTVTHQVAGGTAGEIGSQAVQNAGFADSGAAGAGMRRLESNPALATLHGQVQDAHDQMIAMGQAVGSKQSTVSQAAYAYMGALNTFKSGIPTVNDNPEQAAELNALKQKIENVKKYVGKGLEYAGKALNAAGVEGADKVAGAAGPVVDFLTDQYFEPELNGIQSTIAQYNAAHREHAISASLDNVRAASRAFTRAVTEFNEAVQAFAHQQEVFRDKLRSLGRSADSGHGDRYSQIASLLAEVDTYESQLDEALRLGFQEQTAAREAATSRRTVAGGPGEGGAARQPGMPYYEPYRFFHANGGWGYQCMQHELMLMAIGSSRGSAQGAENVGVNATVDKAIHDLQEFRNEVDPMRHTLAEAMDLRMDNPIPVAAAAAPGATPRSANTGL